MISTGQTYCLVEALVRVCNEIDQSGGGSTADYAFIRAILQDVVVDAMFQVGGHHILIPYSVCLYCMLSTLNCDAD